MVGRPPTGARVRGRLTQTADGLRVIDVWTSRAEFDDFAPKIGAVGAELGMPKPDISPSIDVANFLTAGS